MEALPRLVDDWLMALNAQPYKCVHHVQLLSVRVSVGTTPSPPLSTSLSTSLSTFLSTPPWLLTFLVIVTRQDVCHGNYMIGNRVACVNKTKTMQTTSSTLQHFSSLTGGGEFGWKELRSGG